MEKIIKGTSLKYLSSGLGYHGDGIGSIRQNTHDGDTIKVYDSGNISIRFLGIDTAEISFEINSSGKFISTGNQEWEDYLGDIENRWSGMESELGINLKENIINRIKDRKPAENHNYYAKLAEDYLENLIKMEMEKLEQTKENFKFFLPLAYELFDGYGRLLAFVHPDDKINKPESFNQALLAGGVALPYFIWPNVNPFRKKATVSEAAFNNPDDFRSFTNADQSLQKARTDIKKARQDKTGVFSENGPGPLILDAFELRYLSRQKAPYRWFIDLDAEDSILHHPCEYFRFLPEDRLFIPEHFVPLFASRGWMKSV